MRAPEEIVLRALRAGLEVKLENLVYVMDDDGTLYFVGHKLSGGVDERIYLVAQFMTVGAFIKACRSLPEEDLFSLAAAVALQPP